MDDLKIKQRAFADFFIELGNATEAYKRAYTNIKKDETARANASRLLTNANVKAYIDERMEQLQSERVADQQEILEYLTSVMRGQIEDEQLLVVGDELGSAVEKHTKITDTSNRTKAAELLGKRYALWVDKQEINANVTPVFIDDISGDDDGN